MTQLDETLLMQAQEKIIEDRLEMFGEGGDSDQEVDVDEAEFMGVLKQIQEQQDFLAQQQNKVRWQLEKNGCGRFSRFQTKRLLNGFIAEKDKIDLFDETIEEKEEKEEEDQESSGDEDDCIILDYNN